MTKKEKNLNLPLPLFSSERVALLRAASQEVLSGREYQVLRYIGEGYDVNQIAKALHMSPKTVESHQANIRNKFDMPETHMRAFTVLAARIIHETPKEP